MQNKENELSDRELLGPIGLSQKSTNLHTHKITIEKTMAYMGVFNYLNFLEPLN